MARKKKIIEPENHDRWLVSYADFITLLFAFFVVMYSISSVNEGEYRVLSDSVSSAFSPLTRSDSPIQVGQISRSSSNSFSIIDLSQPFAIMPVAMSKNDFVTDIDALPLDEIVDPALEQASKEIEDIAADVGDSLESFIDDDQVTLRSTPLWLEVEINSNILFNVASAEPSAAADSVLRSLGEVISEYDNNIQVEGFTDNQPIQNSFYPSNWELSSARAAAIVRLFEEYGVDPTRMLSIGYGQFRPITENNTIEGRATNRRVVIVIMANSDSQGGDNIELLRQRISD